MTLSKNKLKLIHSLNSKKIRREERLFVAEGSKTVTDMMRTFECDCLIATDPWLRLHPDLSAREMIVAEERELAQASFLKTSQGVMALFRIPEQALSDIDARSELVLALDGVQDPGNLGTIIRLADWFGIRHILCSEDTVDVYSPKVVQATMGALSATQVCYADIVGWLSDQIDAAIPVYGTFLDGENIYRQPLSRTGVIVMGNEGNGIRPQIDTLIRNRLYIPHPPMTVSSESLNVAIATAVVCAEFSRRNFFM